MLLFELPQILLEDGMVLLELGVLGLQAFELLGELAEPGLGVVSSHGSLVSFTLHHRGEFAKIEKLLILSSQTLLELGILLFGLSKLFLQALCLNLRVQDLLKIIVN